MQVYVLETILYSIDQIYTSSKFNKLSLCNTFVKRALSAPHTKHIHTPIWNGFALQWAHTIHRTSKQNTTWLGFAWLASIDDLGGAGDVWNL